MIKNIKIGTVSRAKKLNELAIECDCEVSILLDDYEIDVKSILGIFSLDITRELCLKIDTDEVKILEKFNEF